MKVWSRHKYGPKGQPVGHRIAHRTCSLELRPQPQSTGVEVNVVAHEGGDEVVGVVVEGLHPQLHVVAVLGRRQEEVLWLQLRLQEAISCALVDQEGHLTEETSYKLS